MKLFSRVKAAKKSLPEGEPAETSVQKPTFSFEDLANDFKTLDPKDPGLWPVAPRALILFGLFASIVTSAWWFGWNVQIEELDQKVAEESKLRDEWQGKKKQAVNLDAYRKQLVDIGNSFGTLLEQLPNQTEVGELLVDINKAAQSRGLVVELFKPGPESKRDFYAENPITMKLTGGYHDIAGFAGDVAQLPRIVTLNEIDLSATATSKNPVGSTGKPGSEDVKMTLNTTAKTFRYMDESEAAEMRKKGGKKK